VGVGQSAENIGDSSYRGMSSVELAALSDTVAGIRQFEISGRTPAPLGKSNNYPRSVAQRIGADPARAIVEPIGGQGPSIWSPSSRARSPPAAAPW